MEIKHNSLKKPENSGSSAQVLASLRAEKLRRTPSTIIKHHRAAKALAASRMAAQVALDKLEARAAANRPAYIYNDGGRKAAEFKGHVGDCVVRSIAIVGALDYRKVYDDLKVVMGKGKSPRKGVPKKVYKEYLAALGWAWTPTMAIGSGCQVHLRSDELPKGRLLVSPSRHLTAVIDGQIHDTHDPSRDGTRCVYGYYRPPVKAEARAGEIAEVV